MSDTDKSRKEIVNLSSVEKDNGNLVVGLSGAEKFVHIPFNKKDKYFMNATDFLKFIKSCEASIRRSPEYARYIAYIHNVVGLKSDMLFPNINSQNTENNIVVHHGPIFNLYDLVEIQIANLFRKGDRINTSNVAHHVLSDHFDNIIQLVVLSEATHNAWHAWQKFHTKEYEQFFIPLSACFGDFGKFIEKYAHCMTIGHVNKIKLYLEYDAKLSKNPAKPTVFNEDITEWAEKFKPEPEVSQ